MKNKKLLIWIAAAVVLVALVLILVLRPSDTQKNEAGDDPAEITEQTSGGETVTGTDATDGSANGTITSDTEASDETDPSSAQLIENEGDIEIIIPDDQASDGF